MIFLGRLAVVPMVLEARGLDVTPGMIKIFEAAKDQQVVDALNVIYNEEVAHVAYGFIIYVAETKLIPNQSFMSWFASTFTDRSNRPLMKKNVLRPALHLTFIGH